MRVLIINTDYPDFLDWLYASHPGLDRETYEAQSQTRNATLFGMADFYSSSLRALGHEAWEVYVNNERAQKTWARESGVDADGVQWEWRLRRGILPWVNRTPTWLPDILAGQIQHYRPDVLLNLAMDGVPGPMLQRFKDRVRLIVGQHAAPLPPDDDLMGYDLVLSSLPNLVERFRSMGLEAEFQRLAFEPRVLDRLGDGDRHIPVSFVGSLTRSHRARLDLLEQLCRRCDLQVWGTSVGELPEQSPLRSRHRGPAWALDMYGVLHASKITLNHHIDIAGRYANNLRLFEATGVGTLLLTDRKSNLAEMFEPGREVVAYETADECAELIEHFLAHDTERDAIARAGQQRTLSEHTYHERAGELLELVSARI